MTALNRFSVVPPAPFRPPTMASVQVGHPKSHVVSSRSRLARPHRDLCLVAMRQGVV